MLVSNGFLLGVLISLFIKVPMQLCSIASPISYTKHLVFFPLLNCLLGFASCAWITKLGTRASDLLVRCLEKQVKRTYFPLNSGFCFSWWIYHGTIPKKSPEKEIQENPFEEAVKSTFSGSPQTPQKFQG